MSLEVFLNSDQYTTNNTSTNFSAFSFSNLDTLDESGKLDKLAKLDKLDKLILNLGKPLLFSLIDLILREIRLVEIDTLLVYCKHNFFKFYFNLALGTLPHVADKTIEVGGYTIPSGTMVVGITMGLMFDPKVRAYFHIWTQNVQIQMHSIVHYKASY